MTRAIFLLSLPGSPYAVATSDPGTLPAATGWDASWLVEPYSLAAYGADGGEDAVRNAFEWSESLDLLTGRLDLSPQSLWLHDAPASQGPAAGLPLASWLCTRDLEAVPYTYLAAPVSASDLTVSVETATGLPATPFTLWVGQEAMTCTVVSGTTLTVTRGVLGTRAQPHTWASYEGTPRVFTSFPGVVGRKVVLWLYLPDAGTLMPVWRGWVGAAPQVSGAAVQLECEPLSTRLLATKLGPDFGTLTLYGISPQVSYFGAGPQVFVQYRDLTSSGDPHIFGSDTALLNGGVPHRDFASFLAFCQRTFVQDPIPDLPSGSRLFCSVQTVGGYSLTVQAYSAAGTINLSNAKVLVGPRVWEGAAEAKSDAQHSRIDVALGDAPECMLRFQPGGSSVKAYATTDYPTPADTSTALSSSPQVTPVWTGDLDEDTRVVVRIATWSDSAASDVYLTSEPKKPRAALYRGEEWLTSAVNLRLSHQVIAPDYATALQGIVGLAAYAPAGLDPDDWNWTLTAAARDELHEGGVSPQIRWYLDQSKSLGDLVEGLLPLYGHCLALVGGRFALRSLRAPLRHELGVATISRADLCAQGERPRWVLNRDLLATSAVATRGDDKITVTHQRALADYGPGRTLEVSLDALQWGATVASGQQLASVLFARLQDRARPVAVASFDVTLELFDLAVGDLVLIADDWLLPDGYGGRGLVNRLARVVGKHPSVGRARVGLDLALYGPAVGAGWAPAAKIGTVAGAVLTLAADYVNDGTAPGGTTDYAGSNFPAYAGTANDLGAPFYRAGEAVRMRRLTDGTEYTGTVASSSDTGTVTLTAPPDSAVSTGVTGGEWWTLIGPTRGSASTFQKLFAHVCNRSTGAFSDSTPGDRWTS